MKKIVSCLAVLALVLGMGSAAMAYNFADHVKMAPNGKGDALIYPVYAAANGGWETKIWVINTALNRSVVAKIVFRSAKNTEELRDFLLYLSPTDVWNGVIRMGASGKPEIYSTDDSSLAKEGVWASEASPLQVPLASPKCADDTNVIGYVEVFMSAHSTPTGVGTVGTTNVLLNNPPVAKQAIFNAYWGVPAQPAPIAGPGDANMVTDGINVLAGHAEFRNLSLGQNSAYSATVLRDYDATLRTGIPLNVADETVFGETKSWNSIGEVEAALNKNLIALPYSSQSGTVHFLTFPTKITYDTSVGCGIQRKSNSPFFARYMTGVASNHLCVPFKGTDYDLKETSKETSDVFSPVIDDKDQLCGEVNFHYSFGYAEGWTLYDFSIASTNFKTREAILAGALDDGSYTGVPVIATVINLGADGLWGLNGAYTDGMVQALTTPVTTYYYYQYQDESNTGYEYDSDIATDEQRTDANLTNHPLYNAIPDVRIP